MSGWVKFVVAVVVASVVGLVVAVVFNPLTALDARFGRGTSVIAIADHISAGRCDQVALPRSGNPEEWGRVCGAMSSLIADNSHVAVTARSKTTRPDPLGLVSTTAYGYTLEVTDRSGLDRVLVITVDEDNRLLGASINQIAVLPDAPADYNNTHRYVESYGFTRIQRAELAAEFDNVPALDDVVAVDEALVGAIATGDCRSFRQNYGSSYLTTTVSETAFVEFCERVAPILEGNQVGYDDLRFVAPPGGGDLIAATNIALRPATEGEGSAVPYHLFVGHDLEGGQWRLRSILAEEDRLLYHGAD